MSPCVKVVISQNREWSSTLLRTDTPQFMYICLHLFYSFIYLWSPFVPRKKQTKNPKFKSSSENNVIRKNKTSNVLPLTFLWSVKSIGFTLSWTTLQSIVCVVVILCNHIKSSKGWVSHYKGSFYKRIGLTPCGILGGRILTLVLSDSIKRANITLEIYLGEYGELTNSFGISYVLVNFRLSITSGSINIFDHK